MVTLNKADGNGEPKPISEHRVKCPIQKASENRRKNDAKPEANPNKEISNAVFGYHSVVLVSNGTSY
jgi:hypothetical protein